MKKVSWRRILQRAGHEFPEDGGMAVPQLREGPQMREVPQAAWSRGNAPPHPGDARAGALETELKRALDRAARRDHESKAIGTPPGWEPIFMAREVSGKAPPPAPKVGVADLKRASAAGGRNILAISLSAVVVSVVFYQIGTQWYESRAGGNGISAIPEATASPASVLYASASTNDAQSGYGVQPGPGGDDPQSLQLRPSLTDDTPPPPPLVISDPQEREAFLQEIEQAAGVLAAQQQQQQRREASLTPVTPETAEPAAAPFGDAAAAPEAGAISVAEEQSMLRRAREFLERGHISGARLFFEHLALQKSALGAFALAQTYDEKFLNANLVKGVEPNPELAEKWYRRAAELGSQLANKQ